MGNFLQKRLPYARQSIHPDDIEAVRGALSEPLITRGPLVEAFEQALKKWCGAEFCVAINSGSSALDAAYFAARGNGSDRILSTPNTFISTIGAATRRGMNPVFVDIDRTTGNLHLDSVLDNLDFESSRGRLFFVPVHFSGIAVDMKRISSALKNPNAIIIEDAAHALGSLYPSGEKVGSCCYSDMTIFSFHPAKTITTGEGGAVLTNNPEYYERLLLYRNNGIVRKDLPWHYDVAELSGNFNFTEMQAALGLSQLSRLDTLIEKRRALVKRYRTHLANFESVRLFTDAFDEHTAFHLFVIQTQKERTALMQDLSERNIGSQYHYIPLYRHSAIKRVSGDISEYFPEMEGYYQSALSLPLYSDLKEEEVDFICDELKKILT